VHKGKLIPHEVERYLKITEKWISIYFIVFILLNGLDSFCKDPYLVLKIPRNATDKEINHARFKLISKVHSDKLITATPEELKELNAKAAEINKAYQTLISTKKGSVSKSISITDKDFSVFSLSLLDLKNIISTKSIFFSSENSLPSFSEELMRETNAIKALDSLDSSERMVLELYKKKYWTTSDVDFTLNLLEDEYLKIGSAYLLFSVLPYRMQNLDDSFWRIIEKNIFLLSHPLFNNLLSFIISKPRWPHFFNEKLESYFGEGIIPENKKEYFENMRFISLELLSRRIPLSNKLIPYFESFLEKIKANHNYENETFKKLLYMIVYNSMLSSEQIDQFLIDYLNEILESRISNPYFFNDI
jgi:hypothetical protein